MTTRDYANDYPDGILPGCLTGTTSGAPYPYEVRVTNYLPDVWASMKYKMPQGLAFCLSKLTNGGYSSINYFQIIPDNPQAGVESIGKYAPNGFVPFPDDVDHIIKDSNGRRIGFILGSQGDLSLKYGDVVLSAVNKLGSSSEQYWELGYQSPHFELQPTLTSQPPRDTPGALTTAQGDQLSAALGIKDLVYSGSFQTNYSNFVTSLSSGVFDTSAYKASPQIGTAYDALEVKISKVLKTGETYDPVITNFPMPITEDSSAKIWVASSDMWGNPSYYWLGNSSKFSTAIDANSRTLYFGVTECDRVLQKGVFPARNAACFPEVFSSMVNFHLVDTAGNPHTRNQEFHADQSFITKLRSLVNIPSLPLSDSFGYMGSNFNTYLDTPANDPASYAYFMGPTTLGFAATPGNGSALTHGTLTNIDRGFRLSCALDTLGLWTYLNSPSLGSLHAPLESDCVLHMVWVFMLVRPNISIGSEATLLDMDMLSGASGLSKADLSKLCLRGKAYTRVPIHIIVKNGKSPSSDAPFIPTAPGGSVKIYGS